MPHWLKWTLGTAAGILLGVWTLRRLASLCGLILAGAVLAYLLSGLALFFERWMSSLWAALLALACFLGALAGSLLLLMPLVYRQLQELAAQLPQLIGTVTGWLDALRAWLEEVLPFASENLGEGLGWDAQGLVQKLTRFSADAARSGMALGTYLLTPFLAFYFLKDRKLFGEWIGYLIPVAYRDGVLHVAMEIHSDLKHYVKGQLLVSLAVGTLTALGLLLLGVDSWLVLGLVMAVCNMIPFFGPWIGAVPIALVALLSGIKPFLLSLVTVVVVQQADNMLLSPRIVGESLQLHPLAVMLTILAGGALLGPLGLLLAMPMLIVLRSVFRYIFRKRVVPSQKAS